MKTGERTIRKSGAGWRSAFVLLCFAVCVLVIEAALYYHVLFNREFLAEQG